MKGRDSFGGPLLCISTLRGQGDNWRSNRGVIPNELPVIISEPKKALRGLEAGRKRPVGNGRDLPRIHTKTEVRDEASQKQDFRAFKRTFLQLGVQIIFSKTLKYNPDMVSVNRQTIRKDENVIQVDDNKLVKQIPEDFVNKILEHLWGVTEDIAGTKLGKGAGVSFL